jgi:hypothetical protein
MFKYQFSLTPPAPPTSGGPGSFKREDLALIYPYIVPKSWVDSIGGESLLAWEFSDDVRMALVTDGHGFVRNLRPADLEQVGETRDSAFEIAAENLSNAFKRQEFELGSATLLDGVQIGCARGNWMAPAGGLLLSALFDAMKNQFKSEEFGAIAVNQQCLFAFPLDERTLSSESLRLAVDDEFNGGVKPISKSWLLIDGQWPREYPYGPRF